MPVLFLFITLYAGTPIGCGVQVMMLKPISNVVKPKYELADIFNLYIMDYKSRHKLSPKQCKVVQNIQNCRTERLGGHILECDRCDYYEQSFNSCGDRHCPKCQYRLKVKWVDARLKELLPVPYYHVVFTVPHFFNDLFLYNKKLLYNLLFMCASQTLDRFGSDPKYLGAKLGYVGILHTWGQKLDQHVHIHFIVAGGGFSVDGKWVSLPYKSTFLFPVRALSTMFRGKFISRFKKLYNKGKLEIPESLSSLKQSHILEHYLNSIHTKKWMVYAKKPFSSPEEVVRYIGRYTHRIAITNYRIRSIENNRVQFDYRDYKDGGKRKILHLSADEFIRRFLLHILPKGFRKIRFYGFWSNGLKKSKLDSLRKVFGLPDRQEQENAQTAVMEESLCPKCAGGRLKITATFSGNYTIPPTYANTS